MVQVKIKVEVQVKVKAKVKFKVKVEVKVKVTVKVKVKRLRLRVKVKVKVQVKVTVNFKRLRHRICKQRSRVVAKVRVNATSKNNISTYIPSALRPLAVKRVRSPGRPIDLFSWDPTYANELSITSAMLQAGF